MAAIFRPALILLLTLTATAPAFAQKDAAPEIVIAQNGAENLLKDLEFVLLANPKNEKAFKNLKELISGYLHGVERNRPIRVDLKVGNGPTRLNFALPIKDRKQLNVFLTESLRPVDLDFRRQFGALYRCKTNTFTGYLRYKHKYAVISEKKSNIPLNMPNPLDGIRVLAQKYDLALQGRNTNIGGQAIMDRRTWFQNNRIQWLAAVKRKANETPAAFKLRKLLLEQNLNEGERFYALSEELLLGWTTDAVKGEGRLNLLLTPIDGTPLDDSIKLLGVAPTHFANIERSDNAILSARVNHPLDTMRQRHFIDVFKAIRDLAVDEIKADKKHTEAEKQAGTNVADKIVQLLTANVNNKGLFDGFVEVHSNPNKKNTAIGGLRTTDGTLVVDILTELAKTDKNQQVKLDADKEGDVRIHTAKIDVKKHPSFSYFVGDDKVYIGSSKDTIWFASGVNALAELKAAIKKAAAPNAGNAADPFVDVYVKVGPWLKLHQERRGNKGGAKARKEALEAFKPGIDELTLQLRRQKNGVVGQMLVQTDILRYAGNVIAKVLKKLGSDEEEADKKTAKKK